MKKIYITGIAGLIGSSLAKHFLQLGHKVKGCDSLVSGYEDNILKGTEWDKIDIRDNKALSESMKGYDIVIHTAALPYEGVSVFAPKLIAENIYAGTVSVASAAIANNYELFINCSSMARYGKGNPPFKETDPTAPLDPYGIAKVHAEDMLNKLHEIHGLKVYHAVPHNVLGPGQIYTDPYRNVAAIFANRLLRGKGVIVYGDGLQIRSFSHISACVEAINRLVELQNKFPSGEVFNIGPDKNEITIKDLAYLVGHYSGIYTHIQYMPDRPQEVKHAFCSSEKAIKELNYNPNKLNNDEIIKDLVHYIRSRGPGEFKYHLDLEIVRDNTPKTWTDKLI